MAGHNIIEYSQQSCIVTCIITGEQWKQNSYIVTHLPSNDTIVVDPGDDADFLIDYIHTKGKKVTRILLTHPHHDHVGAANILSKHFNIVCELHKQDVRLLMHAPMYALRFANKKIQHVSSYLLFEEINNYRQNPILRSLHTPGHTKGSVCYLFDGFAFTGDTLLYKHVGRTDLPGSCAKEISGSVSKLLNELSDDTIIFPGHGKPWTSGEAKIWWLKSKINPSNYNNFSQL